MTPKPTTGRRFFHRRSVQDETRIPKTITNNQVASVPEPGIGILFVFALAGLAMSRRKLVADS
jgi:hypothetical protein